jgi:hypothetical protein
MNEDFEDFEDVCSSMLARALLIAGQPPSPTPRVSETAQPHCKHNSSSRMVTLKNHSADQVCVMSPAPLKEL